MLTTDSRNSARMKATERNLRKFEVPRGTDGSASRISEYFGMNIFDFRKSDMIPAEVKKELAAACSAFRCVRNDESYIRGILLRRLVFIW